MNHIVYPYSEDSALLGAVISESEEGDSFLEIGMGGGGNLVHAATKFSLVVGTDISLLSKITLDVPRDSEIVLADRASCFQGSVFDLVAFNPPYLPSESIEDSAVDGGPLGVEIPLKFLESALEVLKSNGRILILLSSLASTESFSEFCARHALRMEKEKEKKLFFETLTVYSIRRI